MLDGRPVLLLCSNNYLGLSDHPRVRAAVAEAALRWGAGAGSPRLAAGTMTIHRRLEERLAEFACREGAVVFGSELLACAGVIGALAGPGDVIFCDEENHPALAGGWRLSGAQAFVYEHLDVEHLDWGIANSEGRGALIVSESVFSSSGDLAPLEELAELAERHRIRLMVDEAHALGAFGPEGRGAVAQAALEDQVDVLIGSLDNALASYGAFVAGDQELTRYLHRTAPTFVSGTAPPPPALAGALAALDLLGERPELVRRLETNASALRRELDRQGVATTGYPTHIVSVALGDAEMAAQTGQAALDQGVFTQALLPPTVAASGASLRLSVMASHRPEELRWAGRVVAQAARLALSQSDRAGPMDPDLFDVETEPSGVFDVGIARAAPANRFGEIKAPAPNALFDFEAQAPPPPNRIFDVEAEERLAA